MKQPVLGVIVGNRGFFPGHLSENGPPDGPRRARARRHQGHRARPGRHPLRQRRERRGLAEVADLFKQHREEIVGVLVTLPNFGDERAIANAMRWSGLDVPVLVHAFPDEAGKMTRREPPRLVLRQDVGLQQPASSTASSTP